MVRLRTLMPPCGVKRIPPVNHAVDSAALAYLQFADEWASVGLHESRDVYVSPYGVLFRDGHVDSFSLDYSMRGQRNRRSFAKKIALGRVQPVCGTSVSVHNAFFRNYYHWLLEALPRLYCVRDGLPEAHLLVCAEMQAFHRQSLELFGCRSVIPIGRGELAHAERLLFPEPVSPAYGQHNPELLASMARWIKKRAGISAKKERPGRRIYIARRSDQRRKLVNGDQVEALLSRCGFERVVLEGLDFARQVELFDQAAVVASIHGAGLANVIFMPSGGTVIEFVSDRYPDSCLYNLAAACQHRSLVLPCSTTGPFEKSGPKYYDMSVDTEKLETYLDKLKLRVPGDPAHS